MAFIREDVGFLSDSPAKLGLKTLQSEMVPGMRSRAVLGDTPLLRTSSHCHGWALDGGVRKPPLLSPSPLEWVPYALAAPASNLLSGGAESDWQSLDHGLKSQF